MEHMKDKRKILYLSLLLMVAYFVSYITRINFGAVVANIAENEGLLKSTLSYALTGAFITYGAGQLISGYLGDRIQPKYLLLIGFLITALMNTAIPFCKEVWWMTVVWCINGFAQALMWPPMVRLMASRLDHDDYDRAVVIVSFGSSMGTIFVYLVSPLLIMLAGWRTVFFVSAVAGLAMAVVWYFLAPTISMTPPTPKTEVALPRQKAEPMVLVGLGAILLCIVAQGFLRDGITTWMPSFISENFGLGSEISILSGVVLPIFSMGCFQLTSFLYHKKIRNPLSCAALLFFCGTVFGVILLLFSASGPILAVPATALLAASMHGVNLLLICILPPLVGREGRVSLLSGVFNACTYIGSAISTYGIAKISEISGWNSVVVLWCVIALAGGVVCLLVSGKLYQKIRAGATAKG